MDFIGDTLLAQDSHKIFLRGEDCHSYHRFGCHPLAQEGWVFRLWAPQAIKVSLVGDFNGWNPQTHPMECVEGAWECSCTQIAEYTPYKYHIIQEDGQAIEIADPFGVSYEAVQGGASLVCGIGGYPWLEDEDVSANGPLNIYRVNVGCWRRYTDGRPFDFGMLAEQLVPYVKQMGYTHLLLDGVMGDSPFAPDCRYGTPHDLMALVDECHRIDIRVLMEWRLPEQADWSEAATRSYGISCGVYWLEEYHFDGLLVKGDDLTSIKKPPLSFWIRWCAAMQQIAPNALLILEGNGGPTATLPIREGGLGFSRVLDSRWSANTAQYTALPVAHREEYPELLTASLLHGLSQSYVLPLTPLEGAYPTEGMPGDYGVKLAALRVLMGYQMCHFGGKLQYMGTEFGQIRAWDPDGTPDWHLMDYEEHRMIRHYCCMLNRLYTETEALWETEDDLRRVCRRDEAQGLFTFCCQSRKGRPLVAVCHFGHTARTEYPVAVPEGGRWVTVLRSDLAEFGGSCRHGDAVIAREEPLDGYPYRLLLSVPPLTVLFLQPSDE